MKRLLVSVARVVRRFGQDEDGATIVEFALVLLPMLMAIMGGMDLGYQAYLQSQLQGALNDVARTGSMETRSFNCTEESIEERVGCAIQRRSDLVAPGATYRIEMKSYFEFSGIGRSEKLVTDYNNNGQYDTGDCFSDLNENGAFDESAGRAGIGGADDVVFYKVTLISPRLFPLQGILGFPSTYNVEAQTAIRNQPYTRQKSPPTVCV